MTTPKKTIAHYAFDRAWGFNLAARRCEEMRPILGSENQSTMLLCEAIVCYAFSVEVCLKSIIMHESQVAKVEGHQLAKLFPRLNGGTQERIRTIVNDPDFDQKLVEVSKDFVDWRYVYEDQADGKDIQSWIGFLRELSNAAIEAARTIIPPPPQRPAPTAEQLVAVIEKMGLPKK